MKDLFAIEDAFDKEEKKESKKLRKIAQKKDRSKYKKSNLAKKQKIKTFTDSKAKKGRILSIARDDIIVASNGKKYHCCLKGALQEKKTKIKNLLAVGDIVQIQTDKELGQILHVEKRSSILSRQDPVHKKEHIIAVNIDQVFITTSVVLPNLKPFLLDRYIIAAKRGNMQPIIVVNKIDLFGKKILPEEKMEKEKARYEEFLEAYKRCNVPIISVSAKTKEGIDQLKCLMKNKLSVFSGQSGVGKSSLINVTTNHKLKTGPVTQKTLKGAHVTTGAKLIPIDENSFCIDTPGIKGFGVWDLKKHEIAHYFPEIASLATDCKFHNCSHMHEPNCAVKQALDENELPYLRFESYCSLMQSIEEK